MGHKGELEQEQTEYNSMWLHHNYTETLLEYAKNKLIISLSQGDMLLVKDWQSFRVIPLLVPGNIRKKYLLPFPDFDEKHFPFFICSGYAFYMLINVRDLRMDKFIDTSSC